MFAIATPAATTTASTARLSDIAACALSSVRVAVVTRCSRQILCPNVDLRGLTGDGALLDIAGGWVRLCRGGPRQRAAQPAPTLRAVEVRFRSIGIRGAAVCGRAARGQPSGASGVPGDVRTAAARSRLRTGASALLLREPRRRRSGRAAQHPDWDGPRRHARAHGRRSRRATPTRLAAWTTSPRS